MSDSNLKLDALFTIFEKHLYDIENASDESEQDFIDLVVDDYLEFLTTSGVAVPAKWRAQITDELRSQVRTMLVKKMYGCLSIEEFLKGQKDRRDKRKTTRKKYSKMF
jgi:hypothetical protein